MEHQAAKFKLKSICPREIEDYNQRYRAILHQRLEEYGAVQTGAALCLGARQGCFAVGVDLNPGRDNRYVLPGDFHALQFADQSVDIVFSNSFDHAFDLTKLLREVTRVLRPGGLLVLEAGVGMEERVRPVFTSACNGPPWTSSSAFWVATASVCNAGTRSSSPTGAGTWCCAWRAEGGWPRLPAPWTGRLACANNWTFHGPRRPGPGSREDGSA